MVQYTCRSKMHFLQQYWETASTRNANRQSGNWSRHPWRFFGFLRPCLPLRLSILHNNRRRLILPRVKTHCPPPVHYWPASIPGSSFSILPRCAPDRGSLGNTEVADMLVHARLGRPADSRRSPSPALAHQQSDLLRASVRHIALVHSQACRDSTDSAWLSTDRPFTRSLRTSRGQA